MKVRLGSLKRMLSPGTHSLGFELKRIALTD